MRDVLSYMERPPRAHRPYRRKPTVSELANEEPEVGNLLDEQEPGRLDFRQPTPCGCYCTHRPACPPCECAFHNP